MEQRTTKDFFEKPIFVVGAGRSGTSMVMGLFNRAGVWVGETIKGSPENPSGYFENRRLKDGLTKPILSIHGFDKFGRDPIPEETMDIDHDDLTSMVKELLDADGYMYNIPWGFKDAKVLLMWKAWHAAFPKARWILVHRDKEDIVNSILKTAFMCKIGARSVTQNRDREFWGKWVDRYRKGMQEIKADRDTEWYEIDSKTIIDGDFSGLLSVMGACDLRFTAERARKFVKPEYWNRTEEQQAEMVRNDDGQTRLALKMGMNAGRGYILDNIQQNITRQLPQVKEHPVNDQRIAIIGGGPSLMDTADELQRCVDDGVKLVALNGTHDWLVEQGYRPSAMVMVDSRPDNVRFVQKPVSTCKYFISSQCHPDVFEALKDNEVYIWHANNNIGEEQILEDYYLKNFRFIIGGSTVLLRAIWLMRTLGFKQMDVFGFDSCDMNGKHHAYDQPENDGCEMREVTCMGKKFQCAAWQASQFDDFQHFIQIVGDKFELNVHGDGLIAHMMKEGANLFQQESKSA